MLVFSSKNDRLFPLFTFLLCTVFRLKRWIWINCQECSLVARLTYCCHHVTRRGQLKTQKINIRTKLIATGFLAPTGAQGVKICVCLSVYLLLNPYFRAWSRDDFNKQTSRALKSLVFDGI